MIPASINGSVYLPIHGRPIAVHRHNCACSTGRKMEFHVEFPGISKFSNTFPDAGWHRIGKNFLTLLEKCQEIRKQLHAGISTLSYTTLHLSFFLEPHISWTFPVWGNSTLVMCVCVCGYIILKRLAGTVGLWIKISGFNPCQVLWELRNGLLTAILVLVLLLTSFDVFFFYDYIIMCVL